MNIIPGEPIPPGYEDEVTRVADIQKAINMYTGNSLVGLEYTLELQDERNMQRELDYMCVLCDKRGDSRSIMQHWTSFQHRFKYLESNFPTAVRELEPRVANKSFKVKAEVVQAITEAIEKHHGRLPVGVANIDEFRRLKTKMSNEIIAAFHYDEKNGPNFVNIVNRILGSAPAYQKNNLNHQQRDGLDEISSDSDSAPNAKRLKKREQSPAYRIKPFEKESPAPPSISELHGKEREVKIPTPKELSLQASHIAQERYKWEKYRCMLEIQMKQMDKLQKEYEKHPEKHPVYPEEWKAFWNRRYKELQKEGKVDASKYNYRPEWAAYWPKRMKELYEADIEEKKREIKLKLELPEDAEEKTDQLKEKYKVQIGSKALENKPLRGANVARGREGSSQVIDISDDDSPLRRSRSRRRTNSRSPVTRSRSHRSRGHSHSRSISPFSDDFHYEERAPYRRGPPLHSGSRDPPPAPPVSRRYPPSSAAESGYGYDGATKPSYKHSHYSTHYRGASGSGRGSSKEPYAGRSKYEKRSPSPPPPKPKKEPEPEPEPEIEGPLTVVAVLRLLAALEDSLGSLGPKMVDMLGKALALENVKANSADDLLMNDDNCVFFETAKEKLKGLLIAEVIEDPQKKRAVKKAIKHIAAIVHQVNAQGKTVEKKEEPTGSKEPTMSTASNEVNKSASLKDLPFDRQLIASKLAAALVLQGREDLSTADVDKLIYFFILLVKLWKTKFEADDGPLHLKDIAAELGISIAAKATPTIASASTATIVAAAAAVLPNLIEDIFENEAVVDATHDASNDAVDKNAAKSEGNSSLESLTDSDLQTLLQNFKHLSSEEQHHLIAHLKKLETADPERVEKLRKYVNLTDLTDTTGPSTSASAQANAAPQSRNDASTSSTASNTRISSSSRRRGGTNSPSRSLSRDRVIDSDDDYEGNDSATRSMNVSNPNKFSLDDEEDDDYNFEEMLKTASSIVDNKRQTSASDSGDKSKGAASTNSEPPAPGTSKSTNDAALTFNRAGMNMSVSDANNWLTDLMGSLQSGKTKKNENSEPRASQQPQQQQQQQPQPSQQQPVPPPHAPSQSGSGPQTNIPFYQQQQQQQQYQQQQYAQQQQQMPYGGGAGDVYNQMSYMGNQGSYYNGNGGYQGAYQQPPHQQWGNGPPQMPQYGMPNYMPQQQQHPMGYNMYGQGGN